MELDGIVSPTDTAGPRAPEHRADGDHTSSPAWAGGFGTQGRLRAVLKPCLMTGSCSRGHGTMGGQAVVLADMGLWGPWPSCASQEPCATKPCRGGTW